MAQERDSLAFRVAVVLALAVIVVLLTTWAGACLVRKRRELQLPAAAEATLASLLRRFAGKTAEITISVCGGTFVMVTGDFGRAQSRFVIAAQPLEDGQTLCEGIVFARPTRVPLLDKLGLAVRRRHDEEFIRTEPQHAALTLPGEAIARRQGEAERGLGRPP